MRRANMPALELPAAERRVIRATFRAFRAGRGVIRAAVRAIRLGRRAFRAERRPLRAERRADRVERGPFRVARRQKKPRERGFPGAAVGPQAAGAGAGRRGERAKRVPRASLAPSRPLLRPETLSRA